FLGQCQHTDWIGLCRAMLDRPVGTYGDNVQWAANGGHPSNRAKAPPLAPSTWNRNPCWVVLRVSDRHVRQVSVGCEWRLPINSPRGASARFRPYRKTSQSTSAARMISRTASVIPN